ncbi:hypothetical protein [Xenorhabdus lircayensis]|uniref:hypothetical protein n=1 Tax=Xenorhabdus lircayensis TaxID=2763499 RepID=UPI0018E6339A
MTITARSADPNEPIYLGWSCDKNKNEYDEGTLEENGSIDRTVNLIATEDEDRQETVYRYLRTRANINVSMEFMAVVTIDGNKFTTNMQQYLHILTVIPREPYSIKSNKLSLIRDNAFRREFEKGYYVGVYVFYWVLPYSLTIKNQQLRGRDQETWLGAVIFNNADADRLQEGIVLNTDITAQDFRVEDTMMATGLPYGNHYISLRSGNEFIRATFGYCDKYHYSYPEDNSGCFIMITDNLGCVSNYFVMWSHDSKLLAIYNS